MPADLYRAFEHLRKSNGKSRSAIMQDALRYWLAHQGEAEAMLVREYEAGYRRIPESMREIKVAEAAATQALTTDEW
jgi:hypothetical protein